MTQAIAPTKASMRRVKRIHFLGIGGSGMSGIAEVLLNLGYAVSGTDLKSSAATERLVGMGATVFLGHAETNAHGADAIVVSTAVKADNPELVYARAHRIPVVRRAEMLAELMRFRYGIAIAGTHGKTTTTSLVASVLAEAGLDPTFVVGGKVKGADANARLGAGDVLVAEADESDASFLHLNPMITAVTNIDADHLETYGGDFAKLKATFVEFLHQLPFYGLAVLCVDDPVVRELLPQVGRPMLTYGFADDADLCVESVTPVGGGNRFTVRFAQTDERAEFTLNLPGRHNVQNALVAIAIARELGVPLAPIQKAFADFAGVGRRCESHGYVRVGEAQLKIIDDYGHHPRELAATFEAVKTAHPEQRIVVAFQPHRYSRTRDLFDEFCVVLSGCDALVLTEVYAAGEAPLPGYDAKALARGIRARGKVEPVLIKTVGELKDVLPGMVRDGDVLLTVGAGDIGSAPAQLLGAFAPVRGAA